MGLLLVELVHPVVGSWLGLSLSNIVAVAVVESFHPAASELSAGQCGDIGPQANESLDILGGEVDRIVSLVIGAICSVHSFDHVGSGINFRCVALGDFAHAYGNQHVDECDFRALLMGLDRRCHRAGIGLKCHCIFLFYVQDEPPAG